MSKSLNSSKGVINVEEYPSSPEKRQIIEDMRTNLSFDTLERIYAPVQPENSPLGISPWNRVDSIPTKAHPVIQHDLGDGERITIILPITTETYEFLVVHEFQDGKTSHFSANAEGLNEKYGI